MLGSMLMMSPISDTGGWSGQLVQWTADLGILVITAGFLLAMVRLVKGPHLADRALALDTIAIHVIGFVILFTMRVNSLVLFDGVLVLSLLGFAGTIAVAHYVVRPHLRHRPPDTVAQQDD